jgi:hypothetical protein
MELLQGKALPIRFWRVHMRMCLRKGFLKRRNPVRLFQMNSSLTNVEALLVPPQQQVEHRIPDGVQVLLLPP